MSGGYIPLNPWFYSWLNRPDCKQNITISPWQSESDQTTYMNLLDFFNVNGYHQFPRNFLPPDFCLGNWYIMENKGPMLLIATGLLMAISIVVVAGRFLTRKFVAGTIGWDDWTMLIATVILACHTATIYIGVLLMGIGKHFWDNRLSNLESILEIVFTQSLIYTFNVIIIKASLLFFYKRLYGPDYPKMQTFINFFLAFLGLYAVCSSLIFAFQCNPENAFWSFSQRNLKHCPSITQTITLYRCIRAVSVACEVIILFLPMHFVFRLEIPIIHKIGLAFLFGMGSFAVAAAFVRLINHPLSSLDISFNLYPIVLAAQIEHSVGIITASIPALTALFSKRRKLSRYESTGSIELENGQNRKSKNPTLNMRVGYNDRTTFDFLAWAYDPESKNGNHATAYACNLQSAEGKKDGKKYFWSRFKRLRDIYSLRARGERDGRANRSVSGDEVSTISERGMGAPAPELKPHESNEDLIHLTVRSERNVIMMTSTVEVSVYDRNRS